MSDSDRAKRSDSELEEYNPETPYYVPRLASLDPETQDLSDQSQSEIDDAHAEILTIEKLDEPTLDDDEANESAESEYEEVNRNNGALEFDEEEIVQEEELFDNTVLSIDEQSDEDEESSIDEDDNNPQKDQPAKYKAQPGRGAFRNEFYKENLKPTNEEVKTKLEKMGHRIFKGHKAHYITEGSASTIRQLQKNLELESHHTNSKTIRKKNLKGALLAEHIGALMKKNDFLLSWEDAPATI